MCIYAASAPWGNNTYVPVRSSPDCPEEAPVMHRHLLCLLCALVLAACGGEKTGDGVVFLTHTGSSSDSALADPDGGAGETAGTGDTGSSPAQDVATRKNAENPRLTHRSAKPSRRGVSQVKLAV